MKKTRWELIAIESSRKQENVIIEGVIAAIILFALIYLC